MKIKIWCDSGANIHSRRSEEIDLVEYFGVETEEDAEAEWNSMSDDEKYKMVEEHWWNSGLDIGFEEV